MPITLVERHREEEEKCLKIESRIKKLLFLCRSSNKDHLAKECQRSLRMVQQTKDIAERPYDCESLAFYKMYLFLFTSKERRMYGGRVPSKEEFVRKMRKMCWKNYCLLLSSLSQHYKSR